MGFDLVTNLESCAGIIADNADFVKLIYYSHIPAVLAALLVGGFVFEKSRKETLNRALFALALAFTVWTLLDLIAWLSTDSRYIMIAWSLQGFANSLIFICSFYFVYFFIYKKDIPPLYKVIIGLGILPIIIFTPTHFNLTGFNFTSCEASEGTYFLHYYYAFNLLLFIATLFTQVIGYYKASKISRPQILLLSIGVDLFLTSFFITGYLASLLENFNLAIYGLFGMVFFMALLGYLIVHYKAFNVKLIGTQALVMALILLVGSQLFFITNPVQYSLSAATLIFLLVLGRILVLSVTKEVQRKEELQAISDQLVAANQKLKELDLTKSEFISIASHQLRTPLTAIKGYISLILEGSYGVVALPVQDVLNKVYLVNNRLTHLVEDLLNISRIESGRIQYNFEPTQLEPLIAELVDMFMLGARDRKLALNMSLPKKPLPKLVIDPNKIKEAVSNLIDNALKYTKEGSVSVAVERVGEVARITVSDTGIGIHPEDRDKLFEKFIRSKETAKMVVSGVGLGLYVGKNFVQAHGGRIWADSAGAGKGSKFVIELPLENPNVQAGTSDQPSHLKTS